MLFSGQCAALLSPSVFYKSPDSGGSEAEEGDSQGAPIAPRMKPEEIEVGGD